MFKQGILLVDTDNNEKLIEMLGSKYNAELKDGEIRFRTKEMAALKNDIVRAVYSNGLQLNKLNEEVLSLDSLYKQMMEAENESDI